MLGSGKGDRPMRAMWLCVMLVSAAGCTPLDSVPIQPSTAGLSECATVAQATVGDAAAHGYNAVMQDVVFKDSYRQCEQARAGSSADLKLGR